MEPVTVIILHKFGQVLQQPVGRWVPVLSATHFQKCACRRTITLPGLRRIPTEGGEEVQIINPLEADHWGYWAVVENGIYYLHMTAKPALAFFDVNARRTTRIFRSREPSRYRSAGTGGL